MKDCTYNGWKNWETWAAALWIDNEASNYEAKLRYFSYCQRSGRTPTFSGFIRYANLVNGDLSWHNSRIVRSEITEALLEDYNEWKSNRK